ncbi:MAG: lamin tail domain-containing protein [Deltaproteobacteria bacterium]|nr:lamin tail domain-containing protein [Deltaproteobacteria bacterium]
MRAGRIPKLLSLLLLSLAVAAWLGGCGGRSDTQPDSGTDGGTDGGTTTDVEIPAIQNPNHPDYMGEGEPVLVRDVVVTTFQSSKGFWVSEPEGGEWSGIYVYTEFLSPRPEVTIGDLVTIRGVHAEYYNSSQIEAAQVDKTGTAALPPATVVSTSDVCTTCADPEPYEGVLIKVENVEVLNPDFGFGDWTVQPTGGGDELVVQDLYVTSSQFSPTAGFAFTSLTGVLDYSYDEFRLTPTRCEDVLDSSGSAVCVTVECPVGSVTIDQIQNPDHAEWVPPDCAVTVNGAVVTTPIAGDGFWVSDPAGGAWSGIYIYAGHVEPAPQVSVGDLVDIVGTSAEYYESTQIAASSVTVTGTGSLPTPSAVATADACTTCAGAEQWEGVLIQVTDVVIANADFGHGDWTVTPPGGGQELVVEDLFVNADLFEPTAGYAFNSITGILDYSFDEFRLAPTTCDDLVNDLGEPACSGSAECPTEPVTIMQLQDRSREDRVPVDCDVEIEDVVVTAVRPSGGLWVQDPAATEWAGIYVYSTQVDLSTFGVGDTVDIFARYVEYYELSELSLYTDDGHTITATGTAAVPAPQVVATSQVCTPGGVGLSCADGADAEKYEGMLIQVQDVVTTLTPFLGDDQADHGDFVVSSPGVADADVIIGWSMKHGYACPEGEECTVDKRLMGMPFDSVTGVLDFYFSYYRIQPRPGDGDFVEGECDPNDGDCDGILDTNDNCPADYNPLQEDRDTDDVGDLCDNCPDDDNQDQTNSDTDSLGDACDNCPADDNENQANMDGDALGDVCDPDRDGDHIDEGDGSNPCTGGETTYCDDNCPTVPNADQADEDEDGIGDACESGGAHLLLTEICVTPTANEFIEIHNPSAQAVDLSNYYLWDATYANSGLFYWLIATLDTGSWQTSDFLARFPAGASIAPGGYVTIATQDQASFNGVYGADPDFVLMGTPTGATQAMLEGVAGSLGSGPTISNDGEVIVLFYWDGSSDLVQDVDYVVWGDKAEGSDKTGVTVGDSTYLADTPVDDQDIVAAQGHSAGQSWQRSDLSEGAEVKTGGNGISGHDETSEDLSTTWTAAVPTPGAATQ